MQGIHTYSRDDIDQACEIALTHGAVRLKAIRQLLRRGGPPQEQFAFLEEHPIIRQMSDYEAIVQASFGSGIDEQKNAL